MSCLFSQAMNSETWGGGRDEKKAIEWTVRGGWGNNMSAHSLEMLFRSSHSSQPADESHFSKNLYVSKVKGKVKTLSRVRLFATPWTVAHQTPPSMGFSRQEYWSGLPFPSPGDLPDPGIEPGSPAFQADALTSEPPGLYKLTQTQRL